MNTHELWPKYVHLNPRERAELFFAKALPRKDDALADVLESSSLHDAYARLVAELRIIMFGTYWFSKLCLLFGYQLGKLRAHCPRHQCMENEADEEDVLEGQGIALAVALEEFDKKHGGWLRGVAAILNCEELWSHSLALGTLISTIDAEMPFFHQLSIFRENIKTSWADINGGIDK